jgi:hypothetical protein
MAGRLKADALAAAMKLRRESGVIDAPAGDSLETIETRDWTKRSSGQFEVIIPQGLKPGLFCEIQCTG